MDNINRLIPKRSELACYKRLEFSDRIPSIYRSQEDCIDGPKRDKPAFLCVAPPGWHHD
jgi:hypothetical protein